MAPEATMEKVMEIVYEILPAVALGLLFIFKTFGPFSLVQNLKACAPRGKNKTKKALFNIVGEDETRRWAPVLMIGPLPIGLLAMIMVSFGQILFFTAAVSLEGCVALRNQLAYVIGLAYVFLLCFFWTYFGYTYHLKFVLFGRPRKICVVRPFPSLSHVIACYLDLFFVGVLVMAYATLGFSARAETCPHFTLVGFSFIVILVFWIQTCAVITAVFKVAFGKEEVQLSLAASQALKAKKAAEKKAKEDAVGDEASAEGNEEDNELSAAEKNALAIKEANEGKQPLAMQADATESLGMQAVREQFMVIGNMDEVESTDLGELLQNLRIRLKEDEVEEIQEQLNLDGVITFNMFWEWSPPASRPNVESRPSFGRASIDPSPREAGPGTPRSRRASSGPPSRGATSFLDVLPANDRRAGTRNSTPRRSARWTARPSPPAPSTSPRRARRPRRPKRPRRKSPGSAPGAPRKTRRTSTRRRTRSEVAPTSRLSDTVATGAHGSRECPLNWM